VKTNQPFLALSKICLNNWHYIDQKVLSFNDGINFFTGHSGSGKSTTGRSIIRLYDPTEGTILFNGEDISKKLTAKQEKMLRSDMQMVFQDPMASLNPHKKILDTIAMGLDAHNPHMDQNERVERVSKMMEMVGLNPAYMNRYPNQFSGGQRQRIGLGRALIMNPKLVIADEAISALDVSIQAQVVNLMKDIQKETNVAYLFIAHDLSVVRFISDRIAVIYKGRIVELAEAEELFHHPLHPYTKALLSAVPIPDPEIEKKKKLLIYDPTLHDYTISKPQWVEITEGHFVYGNEPELEKYRAEIEAINAAERA
jgi:oligopeptide transport system ATP-binding protein